MGLLGLVLAWTRYDPVESGDLGWCPDAATVSTGEGDTPGGESEVVCTLANTEASFVAFATTVRNTGRFPIVVRDVRMQEEIEGVLRMEAVRMSLRPNTAATSRELVPFAPFRLAGGEQRVIEVRGSLTPCEDVTRPRVATFRSLPLRITVFGLPHDSEAALRPTVRLIGEAC